MNSKQQTHTEVKEVKMIRLAPDFWLRLLGDTSQAGLSANGRNGRQTAGQAGTDRPEMTDYSPEVWLRLLGGAANNGRGPTIQLAGSPPPAKQFTTEFWLRLLGDRG